MPPNATHPSTAAPAGASVRARPVNWVHYDPRQGLQHIAAFDVFVDQVGCGGSFDQALQRLRHHARSLGEQLGIRCGEELLTVRHAALGRDVADEAVHPLLQRDVRPFALPQLVGGGAQQLHRGPIHHFHQMLAGREVAVQRPDAHSGGAARSPPPKLPHRALRRPWPPPAKDARWKHDGVGAISGRRDHANTGVSAKRLMELYKLDSTKTRASSES
jgi:hypothetical protein